MTKRADLSTRLSYALAWIRGQTDVAPAAGLVLGSGLGGLADRLERAVAIPYEEIPWFPVSRVPGHAGRLVVGELAARRRADRRRRDAGARARVRGVERRGRRLRRARAVRASA